MTEICNLTSWSQMTLTSEKVTSGLGRCLYMSQTRIMSIHRLLTCLFSEFCGGKAINGKCQTCCVWPDLWRHRWPRGQIFKLYLKISSRPLHCRLNFSSTSFGYRDRWWGGGGRYAPQQRAGVGLGPAGRGLTRALEGGGGQKMPSPPVFRE